MPKPEDTTADIITALYLGLLGREPDVEGLQHFTTLLNEHGCVHAINSIASSQEAAQRRNPIEYLKMNFGPRLEVETKLNPGQLNSIWQHISEIWSAFGRDEALWSVVTNDRYRQSAKPSPEVIQEFYDGGKADLQYLKAFLDRAELDISSFPLAAEYGCGVGRVTRWLAPEFERVRALDISMPHINAARQHLKKSNVNNVDFVQVHNRKALSQLRDIDLFFSLIVLQHNPPPIILDVLDHAFGGLNKGGVAFFQVPTYATAYRFKAKDYLAQISSIRDMEMHFVPQSKIFSLAIAHGLEPLETRQDHCIGNHNNWISNTFLFQKRR